VLLLTKVRKSASETCDAGVAGSPRTRLAVLSARADGSLRETEHAAEQSDPKMPHSEKEGERQADSKRKCGESKLSTRARDRRSQ
jgi:hypothetical protein